jgi:hypothetical protein
VATDIYFPDNNKYAYKAWAGHDCERPERPHVFWVDHCPISRDILMLIGLCAHCHSCVCYMVETPRELWPEVMKSFVFVDRLMLDHNGYLRDGRRFP